MAALANRAEGGLSVYVGGWMLALPRTLSGAPYSPQESPSRNAFLREHTRGRLPLSPNGQLLDLASINRVKRCST